MTQTNSAPVQSHFAQWRSRLLATGVVLGSLVPVLTNGGCSSTPIGCPTGQTDCNGVCTTTTVDPYNCGTCGNTCSVAGSSCVNSQCDCNAGLSPCNNDSCVDLLSDGMNCGGCNMPCGAGTFCSAGVCGAGCPVGTSACGSSCINTLTDVLNCGDCNRACGPGQTCENSVCSGDQMGGVGGTGNPAAGGNTGAGGGPGNAGGSPGNTGGMMGNTGGSEGSGLLGGYHTHGDWSGFAFAFATEATISPASFETLLDSDGPFCVSGTVPATEEYTAIAAVGVHASQQKIQDAPVNTISSSGDGLLVDLTVNSGEESIRIQLEDDTSPDAADAAEHRWCANITGTQVVTIPWESFSTECWEGLPDPEETDSTNVIYDGRPLAKVIAYVPDAGPDGVDQDFDFCLNDIGPANVVSRGMGEIVADCGNSGVTWGDSISDPFGQVNAGNYSFQNNKWNAGAGGNQTAQLLAGAGFRLTTQTCSTQDDSPCSFPSVYVGTDADGTKTSGFNAQPISGITSIPTCLGWSSGGTPSSDEYNVSYDVWFNSNAGANIAEKFLMVWFRDPPNFQPGGMFPIQDGVVIGDQTWSVWFGPNAGGQDVISYVAPNKRADGQAYSFDLKDFIDDAVERDALEPSLNLIAIMGGMEIWGGAQGASIDGFRAEVQ